MSDQVPEATGAPLPQVEENSLRVLVDPLMVLLQQRQTRESLQRVINAEMDKRLQLVKQSHSTLTAMAHHYVSKLEHLLEFQLSMERRAQHILSQSAPNEDKLSGGTSPRVAKVLGRAVASPSQRHRVMEEVVFDGKEQRKRKEANMRRLCQLKHESLKTLDAYERSIARQRDADVRRDRDVASKCLQCSKSREAAISKTKVQEKNVKDNVVQQQQSRAKSYATDTWTKIKILKTKAVIQASRCLDFVTADAIQRAAEDANRELQTHFLRSVHKRDTLRQEATSAQTSLKQSLTAVRESDSSFQRHFSSKMEASVRSDIRRVECAFGDATMRDSSLPVPTVLAKVVDPDAFTYVSQNPAGDSKLVRKLSDNRYARLCGPKEATIRGYGHVDPITNFNDTAVLTILRGPSSVQWK